MIKKYIKSVSKIDTAIIGGDFNQDIVLKEVTKFFENLKVKDTYYSFNITDIEEIDHTHGHETKCMTRLQLVRA